MRVLAIGSMYPPHYLGGQELVWQGSTAHLREHGHEVRVLSSDYRRDDAAWLPDEPDVHRELRWYWRDHDFPRPSLLRRLALERHNARVLARHLDWRPDVAIWWSLGGMSLSLVEAVRRAGVPAVGVVGDDWMVYAPEVDAWSRFFRRRPLLASPVARLSGVPTRVELGSAARWLFVSEHLRRKALAHLPLPGSGVAHPGIDPRAFPEAPPREWRWRLLYVGRIDPRKGIDLAIAALQQLPPESSLEVVGSGDEAHLRRLHELRTELGLDDRVRFRSARREELAGIYASADAVLFPVLWEEPWGLVPLEAMAVGRPVVATGRGGSGEYLRDGENCLIFDPDGGSGALAAAVARLADNPPLRERLRAGGRETAAGHDEATFNAAVLAALEQAAGS